METPPTGPADRVARAGSAPRRTAALALAVVAVVLAAPVVVELVALWLAVPYYTHAFLVPAFSAWLLWDLRYAARPARAGAAPALTIAAFLLGLGLLVVGTVIDSASLRALAVPALAFPAVLVLVPDATPRRVAFPVGFLVLMTPMPEVALTEVSLALQHLAATVTAGVLAAGGIPYVHAGLFIHLQGVTVHISEACNGLRFLLAMLTTGIAFAGLVVGGMRMRLLVVGLAIVAAILANLVRVASTALIAHAWGAEAASGLPHVVYGKVVYAAALGGFLALVLMLRRRGYREAGGTASEPPDVSARTSRPAPGSPATAAGRSD